MQYTIVANTDGISCKWLIVHDLSAYLLSLPHKSSALLWACSQISLYYNYGNWNTVMYKVCHYLESTQEKMYFGLVTTIGPCAHNGDHEDTFESQAILRRLPSLQGDGHCNCFLLYMYLYQHFRFWYEQNITIACIPLVQVSRCWPAEVHSICICMHVCKHVI